MKITKDKAEEMYRKEIEENTINTENTPHYDSLLEYIDMLKIVGYEVD